VFIALSVEERLKLRAWFGTLKEIELVALASTAFHFLERFSFAYAGKLWPAFVITIPSKER